MRNFAKNNTIASSLPFDSSNQPNDRYWCLNKIFFFKHFKARQTTTHTLPWDSNNVARVCNKAPSEIHHQPLLDTRQVQLYTPQQAMRNARLRAAIAREEERIRQRDEISRRQAAMTLAHFCDLERRQKWFARGYILPSNPHYSQTLKRSDALRRNAGQGREIYIPPRAMHQNVQPVVVLDVAISPLRRKQVYES